MVKVFPLLLIVIFKELHILRGIFLGQEESTLEKLKCDIVCNWLREISRTHYKLFISCLLPHPPDYARVGGHW